MTKRRIFFAAALGLLAGGLFAVAPASAGPITVTKPVISSDGHADLHLIDRGSWKKKHYFKKKKHYFKSKKHFRGDHYYGRDDGHYKYRKKKKYRRAYRDGYDQGYDEGRRDSYYNRGDGYYYYGKRPRFRSRGHHRHRHHRFGSGYIKTPGFYFRF